jgi:hypothetical protein
MPMSRGENLLSRKEKPLSREEKTLRKKHAQEKDLQGKDTQEKARNGLGFRRVDIRMGGILRDHAFGGGRPANVHHPSNQPMYI